MKSFELPFKFGKDSISDVWKRVVVHHILGPTVDF